MNRKPDLSHLSPAEAKAMQLEWASQVSQEAGFSLGGLRLVAGADVSYEKRAVDGYAAIVVCTFPDLEVVEIASAAGEIAFPYIPGLLSFRELPLLEEAWKKLKRKPQVLICDGQGRAHPRRLGLASHAGLMLSVPAIGCGKSRLIGTHEEPGNEKGSQTDLYDGEELIGKVVRTRKGVKPLYISIGHQVNLSLAVRLILNLCRGYRQPEVIRLAHREVNRLRTEAGL